jgi:hypothetical protein
MGGVLQGLGQDVKCWLGGAHQCEVPDGSSNVLHMEEGWDLLTSHQLLKIE